MTETTTQPRAAMATPEAPSPEALAPEKEAPPTSEVRLGRRQSFGLAIASLVLVYGLGLVVMLAGGAVIHAVDPAKHVDSFAAFHNRWVVGALLGITALWLLPPYPWAKRVIAPGSQEQPAQAGRTEDGGGGAFAVRSDVPGPGAVHRPGGGRPD